MKRVFAILLYDLDIKNQEFHAIRQGDVDTALSILSSPKEITIIDERLKRIILKAHLNQDK